jgi:type I site-specific restriction endonuclease
VLPAFSKGVKEMNDNEFSCHCWEKCPCGEKFIALNAKLYAAEKHLAEARAEIDTIKGMALFINNDRTREIQWLLAEVEHQKNITKDFAESESALNVIVGMKDEEIQRLRSALMADMVDQIDKALTGQNEIEGEKL